MLLTLGMGSLGALLGVLIAWSASPVVATAMPLIFGLIGGASGFSLLKLDLSKPNNQEKLKLIGGSLLTCCSACLVALLLAVFAKGFFLQKEISNLHYELNVERLTEATAVDKIMLRKRLEFLGAGKTEIKALLEKDNKPKDLAVAIGNLYATSKSLISAYDELSESDKETIEKPNGSSSVLSLYNVATLFLTEKEMFDSAGESTITDARFSFLTRNLNSFDFGNLYGGFFDQSKLRTLTSRPKLVTAVAKLAITVQQDDQSGDTQLKRMDDLMKIIATSKEASSERSLIAADFNRSNR
jgi:hypothetical protein